MTTSTIDAPEDLSVDVASPSCQAIKTSQGEVVCGRPAGWAGKKRCCYETTMTICDTCYQASFRSPNLNVSCYQCGTKHPSIGDAFTWWKI